jgi:putative hydrolase of the HAD superfamily
MIEALLFDLFGVVARPQSAEGQELLVATADAPAADFWATYWQLRPPYDRGQLTGPQYWRQVADTLGLRFTDERVGDLIEADIASWSALDGEMTALVAELAGAGQRLALLSNIPQELASFYEKRLQHFEIQAFSCRIGHAKPEPAAYRWCCEALDVEPRRILFIDDRAENIAAAEAIGLRGHLFTGPAALKTTLSETLQPGVSRMDQR